MSQTITNKQGTLQGRDFWRGLIIAVLTAAITIALDTLQSGTLSFNWELIGTTSLSAGLAYILKNWLEPTRTITIHDTPKG